MGNSKIYYFPTSADVAGRQEIDFGEIISDLHINPYRVVSDAVSIGGRLSRVARRSGMRVRIVHERFTDEALARKLYSLQSHLEAGGAISFAVDSSNTYAAFTAPAVSVTTGIGTTFKMEPELFSSYGGGNPANGDVMHVESLGISPRREEITATTYSAAGPKITLSAEPKYNHVRPVLIRHRDFFPALFWPQDQTSTPILSSDRRISYTLDMTLEVYPAQLATLAGLAGSDGLPIGGNAPSSKSDLDAVLGGPLGGIGKATAKDKAVDTPMYSGSESISETLTKVLKG